MSYFLQLEGIDGDSRDDAHRDWHEVSGLGWEVGHSTRAGAGMATRAGRPVLEPIVVSTPLGPALPRLFEACVTGRTIPTATLDVVRDGDPPLVVLKIELEAVMLSSLSLAGSDGDPQPLESFSLTYRRITLTTNAVDAGGVAAPASSAAWDVTGRP